MYTKFGHFPHVILYTTPLVLQFIGELILYVVLVWLHMWVFVLPFGEKLHVLHNSPQFLKPSIFLGIFFGGILALINMSLRFFDLLYAITEGFLKHLFNRGDSSVITFQCFLTILETGGISGWKVVTKTVFSSFVFDTRLRASLRSI